MVSSEALARSNNNKTNSSNLQLYPLLLPVATVVPLLPRRRLHEGYILLLPMHNPHSSSKGAVLVIRNNNLEEEIGDDPPLLKKQP